MCAGFTWISTGRLHTAKRVCPHAYILTPALQAGTTLVVPRTQLRSSLPIRPARTTPRRRRRAPTGQADLRPGRGTARDAPDWHPPQIRPARGPAALPPARGHILHPERQLLDDAGVSTDVLDAGSCRPAGDSGREPALRRVDRVRRRRTSSRLRNADRDTLVRPKDSVAARSPCARTQQQAVAAWRSCWRRHTRGRRK